MRVSGSAQGEGPGGALHLYDYNKLKNSLPHPQNWFVNHPSSPNGNYLSSYILSLNPMVHPVVTSLGMNSSTNPPLGDHPGVASKKAFPPFHEPRCLSLPVPEMRTFRSPKGRQTPERNITWNVWIVRAILLKKSKKERSNAWNVAVLSLLWFCALLRLLHPLSTSRQTLLQTPLKKARTL